jgi:hypothetical protein
MHCHLIVSCKDQSNKKKLSPLTNHKNTQKGTVKGGFDRKNLFQQAEQGFDKLFGYDRQLTESFEYYNTMKNDTISDQLKMQERKIGQWQGQSRDWSRSHEHQHHPQNTVAGEKEKKQAINLPDMGLSSALGILTPEPGGGEEQPHIKPKKKKKRNKGQSFSG